MIEHRTADRRFVTQTDDGEAYLAYEESGDRTLDFQHTIVPTGAQGNGVGELLVRGALDYARQHGYRVIPSCPFVAAYLEKHPEAERGTESGR